MAASLLSGSVSFYVVDVDDSRNEEIVAEYLGDDLPAVKLFSVDKENPVDYDISSENLLQVALWEIQNIVNARIMAVQEENERVKNSRRAQYGYTDDDDEEWDDEDENLANILNKQSGNTVLDDLDEEQKKSMLARTDARGADPIPISEHIIDLNYDFEEVLGEDDVNMWFIDFYTTWCVHCTEFNPDYLAFAEKVHEKERRIRVASYDCGLNEEVCLKYNVTSYPTVGYFAAGSTKNEETLQIYWGEQNGFAIAKFALEMFEENIVPPELDELTNVTSWDYSCGRLCVIAVLPHILEGGGRDKEWLPRYL